ncbi:mitogen-activated protein kinase kinase kinase 12 [Biomphalaria glabrata]|nr:mitogen-activated protein kinase kinase kinase 12 [Biomphalaria glabrata]
MRARKSRHRRNNSRGSMKDITSRLKSQSTYEASLNTQTSDKLNPAELHPTDLCLDIKLFGTCHCNQGVSNFGCNGGCSDATCSNKCSSQVSADVESICDLSPLPSPKQNMSEESSPDIDLSSRPETFISMLT